jgi:hypothetical protein
VFPRRRGKVNASAPPARPPCSVAVSKRRKVEGTLIVVVGRKKKKDRRREDLESGIFCRSVEEIRKRSEKRT